MPSMGGGNNWEFGYPDRDEPRRRKPLGVGGRLLMLLASPIVLGIAYVGLRMCMYGWSEINGGAGDGVFFIVGLLSAGIGLIGLVWGVWVFFACLFAFLRGE